MFMDTETIDHFYDACIEHTGQPPMVALYDRTVLVPLDYLADRLSEPEREVTAEQVRAFAGKRWVTILHDSGDPTTAPVPSLPLYAIDRLKAYLSLSAASVSDAELAAHAEYEEWMIDALFGPDGDLAYVKDDLDLLIADADETIELMSAGLRREGGTGVLLADGEDPKAAERVMEQRLRSAERNRRYLLGLDRDSMSEAQRQRIGRFAHRVRSRNEMIRVILLQPEYERMREGWSFFINLTHETLVMGDVVERSPSRPSWESTLVLPLVNEDTVRLPIRVPGFILRDDTIHTTRTLTPDEYRTLWEAADLDRYLAVVREVWSERACPQCRKRLPRTAADQRVYCSRTCSNAARQAKWRTLNPDAAKRAQNRWRRA